MPLLNRQKHKLLDILAPTYLLRDQATSVLDNVGIDYDEIDIEGSSTKRWNNIIKAVKDLPVFDDLRTYLRNNFAATGANEDKQKKLIAILDEIDSHSPAFLFNLLAEKIPLGECVLFLGPDAFRCLHANKVQPFNHYLAGQLVEEKLEPMNIFYEEGQSDNLGYLIDRFESRENSSVADTKAFAEEQYREIEHQVVLDQYNRLANLNFKLVVNTNPDLIFARNNNDFVRLRYDQSNTQIQVVPDDLMNSRFIYNIYGSFENPQSVLFTEKEAVSFTKGAYINHPPILNEVKAIVKHSYGLFIGFDFKEWPLKILFDVLDLKNKPGNFSVSEEDIPDQYLEYYARQYNMTFVTVDANFFNQL